MRAHQSAETDCSSPAVDPVMIEARWQVNVGPAGAWVPDEPTRRPNAVHQEGIFSIAIPDRDGNRVRRFIRSRWSRARPGGVEGVEILCGACSAPLMARDVPVRLVRMFACRLSCPRCARGTIVCGSKRTLFMALRVWIDEKRNGNRDSRKLGS